LTRTAWQQLLSGELQDGGGLARAQKFLSQKDLIGADHLATAASHLKSLRMLGARLESNSFWAGTIWWRRPPGKSCSYLKSFRMEEVRLGLTVSGRGGSGLRGPPGKVATSALT
jgi:hypothetical protein